MSAYFMLLAFMLVGGYYVSGIFTYEDLSLDNFQDKLLDVILHFYVPWRYYNEKTIGFVGLAFVGWLLLVSYIIYHFRDYRFYTEHGTAEWGDIDEYNKKHSDASLGTDRILSENVRVSIDGDKALSNNNMLVIATSGCYKTTGVLTPNILRGAANFIMLDVKGDTLFKYGNYLESIGYEISVLNTFCPDESDGYNPMEYVENEKDINDLINNIYDALEPPDSIKNDPFWTEGPKLYMSALFNYEFYMAQYENRKAKLTNVLKYLDDERREDLTKEENPDTKKRPSILESKMRDLIQNPKNLLKDEHPAVRDYFKLKEGAAETVRSIVIIVNAKLKLFNTDGINTIFENDELKLRDFAYGVGGDSNHITNKKKALFICVDAFNTSYHFVASILYSQAVTVLSRIALNEFKDRGSCLPIPLEFWMDEFYTGARPYNTVTLLGVIRSINMSMILFLQSHAQVLDLFDSNKTEIILDNCPVVLFGGCGPTSKETAEWISGILNKETIDTEDDSTMGQQMNTSHGKTGVDLMTPDMVMKMEKTDIIIFTQSEKPLMDHKSLPWEMPEDVVPFKRANDLNKKSKDKGWVNHVKVYKKNGETFRIREQKAAAKLKVINEADVNKERCISLNSDEFLNANLQMSYSSKDVENIYHTLLDLRPEEPSETSKNSNDSKWDFSGSVNECIMRYKEKLTAEQLGELLLAQSCKNIPEDEVKAMIVLPADRMRMVRVAYETNQQYILKRNKSKNKKKKSA